jgi:1,4-dihydroxy-2-naphthoyl-CoA hydrolase
LVDLHFEYDHSPFERLVGLRIEEASRDRVVGVLPVTTDLLQGSGFVHGGAYATAIEATASIGAELWFRAEGHVVGLSNDTEVRREVRTGELRVEATPLERGRETQLWQVAVTDERGRLVAHGQVLLKNLRKR